MTMQFTDRSDAGRQLAKKLARFSGNPDVVICALPRGGVVLGVEVARALKAPLGLLISRKIGHPSNPEYAIASVTEKGEPIESVEGMEGVDRSWFDAEVERQRHEAARRRLTYMPGGSPELAGKTVIVVDDGIATGLTMEASVAEAKRQGAAKVIVAVPFCPPDSELKLGRLADEVITVFRPQAFHGAVGAYYDEFPQVEDEEVIRLMHSV